MDNSTNATNVTWSSETREEIYTALTLAVVFYFLFFILGTFINVWLLACIVKSKELRSKLRNQMICNICVLHLTETLLMEPLTIFNLLQNLHGFRINFDHFCILYSVVTIVEHIQACVEDWQILILAALFLANVLDFDPSSKMTPRTLKIATASLHAAPWVFAAVATPAAFLDLGGRFRRCVYIMFSHHFKLVAAYTAVPLGLATVVILTACVLRWVRYRRGSLTARGHMGVQLLGRGPEVDNGFTYLLAVATVVVCGALYLVLLYDYSQRRYAYRGMAFFTAAIVLQASRVVLLPPVWLLLPDIRTRLKVWRPWRAETSGIDLAVSYKREEGTVEAPHYSG